MSKQSDLLEIITDSRSSRRNILKSAAAGTLAMAAGAILPGCGGSGGSKSSSGVSAADVLNFALNLEYLEAEFYLLATTGQPLSAADSGQPTTTIAGDVFPASPLVSFTNYGVLANEIAQNELAHVRFLRAALGASAVVRPPIDLVNSFNAAASAAGIGPAFNPFSSENNFIVGAFVFEDVGVTAYHGGAGYLTGNSAYLSAAAGILGVEAYHAGAIRNIILQLAANGTSGPLSAANAISNLRASADGSGGSGNEQAPGTVANGIVVPVDSNAIAFARTPQEVLNIVYNNASGTPVHSGGFFPSGLNGKIK